MTNQTIIEAAKVALVDYESTAKDLIIEAAKEAGLVAEAARFLSLANIEVTRDLAHEALLKQFDRIVAPCCAEELFDDWNYFTDTPGGVG